MVDEHGKSSTRRIRTHNFHRAEGHLIQRYERATDVLDQGDFALGTVHGAPSLLLNASALRERAVAKMKEDPFYFIDDPNGIYKKSESSEN